jgi:hypothetical protein
MHQVLVCTNRKKAVGSTMYEVLVHANKISVGLTHMEFLLAPIEKISRTDSV